MSKIFLGVTAVGIVALVMGLVAMLAHHGL
jgi:hypothetical protein